MANKSKRSVPHYNGLKVVVLVGGLMASTLATRMIMLQERPAYTQEVAPAQPTSSGPGFDPSALRPIPTALPAKLVLPTPTPAAVAQVSAGGNPPQQNAGGAVAGGGSVSTGGGSLIPAVIGVGPLPAISGGGGGGGGGGQGRSSPPK